MAATWEEYLAGAGKQVCRDCGEHGPLDSGGRCWPCGRQNDEWREKAKLQGAE